MKRLLLVLLVAGCGGTEPTPTTEAEVIPAKPPEFDDVVLRDATFDGHRWTVSWLGENKELHHERLGFVRVYLDAETKPWMRAVYYFTEGKRNKAGEIEWGFRSVMHHLHLKDEKE